MLDILERIQSGEMNIAKLAKDTGIPSTRVYKWKDRGSKITLEDAMKIEEWASKQSDNSIESSNLEPKDREQEPPPGQMYKAIQELVSSVKKIEKRIQEVFPEGKGNLLDVVKAIQSKGTEAGKGKSGKQK